MSVCSWLDVRCSSETAGAGQLVRGWAAGMGLGSRYGGWAAGTGLGSRYGAGQPDVPTAASVPGETLAPAREVTPVPPVCPDPGAQRGMDGENETQQQAGACVQAPKLRGAGRDAQRGPQRGMDRDHFPPCVKRTALSLLSHTKAMNC